MKAAWFDVSPPCNGIISMARHAQQDFPKSEEDQMEVIINDGAAVAGGSKVHDGRSFDYHVNEGSRRNAGSTQESAEYLRDQNCLPAQYRRRVRRRTEVIKKNYKLYKPSRTTRRQQDHFPGSKQWATMSQSRTGTSLRMPTSAWAAQYLTASVGKCSTPRSLISRWAGTQQDRALCRNEK